jgi:hypothetical protein
VSPFLHFVGCCLLTLIPTTTKGSLAWICRSRSPETEHALGLRAAHQETLNGTARTYGWSYAALKRMSAEALSGTAPTGTLNYAFDRVRNRTRRAGSLDSLGAHSLD